MRTAKDLWDRLDVDAVLCAFQFGLLSNSRLWFPGRGEHGCQILLAVCLLDWCNRLAADPKFRLSRHLQPPDDSTQLLEQLAV